MGFIAAEPVVYAIWVSECEILWLNDVRVRARRTLKFHVRVVEIFIYLIDREIRNRLCMAFKWFDVFVECWGKGSKGGRAWIRNCHQQFKRFGRFGDFVLRGLFLVHNCAYLIVKFLAGCFAAFLGVRELFRSD